MTGIRITGDMDAVILAGGQGQRIGYGVRKPFLPLGQETLVERDRQEV
ncbi:MAG: NTP transferase domain-containing protein [Chloroflexi bacterium]|nr:NTP transferase domain-containing protein [Chloroflexota bacterium]